MKMDRTEEKHQRLLNILRSYGGILVAFSGGTDSAYLLAAAREALGDSLLAVTAGSPVHGDQEVMEAEKLAREIGVEHRVIKTHELDDPDFRMNPPDRCYICKKGLLRVLKEIARKENLAVVVEGTNQDDLGDYRPGRKAVLEMGVLSPLLEAGLTKAEIRTLSKKIGLSTWDRPTFSCFATRIPYGEELTPERLGRVARAEEILREKGFSLFRVRDHGGIARIEIPKADLERAFKPDMRLSITTGLKALGFKFVTLDLEGFRSGSMNDLI